MFTRIAIIAAMLFLVVSCSKDNETTQSQETQQANKENETFQNQETQQAVATVKSVIVTLDGIPFKVSEWEIGVPEGTLGGNYTYGNSLRIARVPLFYKRALALSFPFSKVKEITMADPYTSPPNAVVTLIDGATFEGALMEMAKGQYHRADFFYGRAVSEDQPETLSINMQTVKRIKFLMQDNGKITAEVEGRDGTTWTDIEDIEFSLEGSKSYNNTVVAEELAFTTNDQTTLKIPFRDIRALLGKDTMVSGDPRERTVELRSGKTLSGDILSIYFLYGSTTFQGEPVHFTAKLNHLARVWSVEFE